MVWGTNSAYHKNNMSHILRIAILTLILAYAAFTFWITGISSIPIFSGAILLYLMIEFSMWLETRNVRWMLKNYKRRIFQLLRNINQYHSPKLNHNASRMEIEIADFYDAIGRQFKKKYQAEKDFTQNASHELQTPITVIRSAVDTILQSPNLTEDDYTNLSIILKNANKVSKINNALVILSRIQSYHNDNPEKINFNPIIKELIENSEGAILMKNISVQIKEEAEFWFTMNSTLAEVLLSNLVRNAIKHNIPGGNFEIKITGQNIRFLNTGKEIQSSPESLFERFAKFSENPDSIGLGLSIVKSICDYSGLKVDYYYKNGFHELVLKR
jgi:signal transduction histidine kinase